MHGNASLDDIAAYLDELLDAPHYAASEPDSNGLIFRAGAGVTKVAVAVNTSITAVVGAAKGGAQLLIVHHPPWAEVDRHLRDEKLGALEASGVSLYAAHSSLDCAPMVGNGWALAALLGVTVEQTFMEYHGGHAGVAGPCDDGSFGARGKNWVGVVRGARDGGFTTSHQRTGTRAGNFGADLNVAHDLFSV